MSFSLDSRMLFFLTALLRYNSHTIQFSPLMCTIHTVFILSVFSIFTELCNHHHNLIQDTCIPLEEKPVLISRPSPFPLPQPLATTNPFLVPVDLPVLDVSYKWNHTPSVCV